MSGIIKFSVLIFCIPAYFINSVFGQDYQLEPDRIEDNSFLIEEGYNQEPGVIQHISTFQFTNDNKWLYTYTLELPLRTQKSQLSATIPYLDNGEAGLGDIALNYRYQAILGSRFAFSPRISLLFPTGNYKKGSGTDVMGYQLNLPFSYLIQTGS